VGVGVIQLVERAELVGVGVIQLIERAELVGVGVIQLIERAELVEGAVLTVCIAVGMAEIMGKMIQEQRQRE
jgi:hypothetical protein